MVMRCWWCGAGVLVMRVVLLVVVLVAGCLGVHLHSYEESCGATAVHSIERSTMLEQQ